MFFFYVSFGWGGPSLALVGFSWSAMGSRFRTRSSQYCPSVSHGSHADRLVSFDVESFPEHSEKKPRRSISGPCQDYSCFHPFARRWIALSVPALRLQYMMDKYFVDSRNAFPPTQAPIMIELSWVRVYPSSTVPSLVTYQILGVPRCGVAGYPWKSCFDP